MGEPQGVVYRKWEKGLSLFTRTDNVVLHTAF